jgi:hypothetical protein
LLYEGAGEIVHGGDQQREDESIVVAEFGDIFGLNFTGKPGDCQQKSGSPLVTVIKTTIVPIPSLTVSIP